WVCVDWIRCVDSSRIDEASSRLEMIERLPVLQMELNELGIDSDVFDELVVCVAARNVARAKLVCPNLAGRRRCLELRVLVEDHAAGRVTVHHRLGARRKRGPNHQDYVVFM